MPISRLLLVLQVWDGKPTQGSRLRRPSILNTRYFRFGRKFRLSVRPSGRDFYEGNISALEANFGGTKRRYASNIYNTENKLYILKLNGFERFPGKLFTSIVKRDFYYATIAYHVGLNAVLGLPHPGPTS